MIKKLLSVLFVATCIFGATSCTSEDLTQTESGESVKVSFSLGLEGGIDTRAISDGSGTNRLVYAVFDQNGTRVNGIQAVDKSTTFPATEELTLVKNKSYKIAFWAQNSTCSAYTVDADAMTIGVNYAGLNNDETRDAYYHATMPFKLDRHLSKEVVLKRPFAQVNVGTYESELEYVKESGAEVTHSAATIKGVANQINLIDGTVSGNVDVSYSPSAIPTETLFVDVDKDDMKEAYEYMSMCYVLAGDKNSVHEVSFEFSDASGQTVATAAGVDLISLLRNWRTNILGYFFTGNANLDIVIDAEYENDYNVITSNKDIYYNVTEDTVFENSTYIMSNYNVGLWFASESGQLITANNIRIYGSVWTVSFGEYRGAKYYNYNNLLNNVVCKDLVVSNVIKDHDVYVSVGTQIYGKSTLNNCKMTGTTTVATVHFDGTPHDYTPVDIGIPNECDAVLNDCEVGSMYLWTHAVVTLNNTTVDRIICSCCNSTKHSNLTVAAGSTVGVIDCTQPAKYGSRLIIEEGATVGELNLVNASFKDMDIRGTVNKITYQGVEYTLDELKALGL